MRDLTGFIDTDGGLIGIEEIDSWNGFVTGYGDGITGMGDG